MRKETKIMLLVSFLVTHILFVSAAAATDTVASNITATTTDITWTTATTSYVTAIRFGTISGQYTQYGYMSCDPGATVNQVASLKHCVRLSPLLPATTYYYLDPAISTGNAAGGLLSSGSGQISNEKQFTTLDIPVIRPLTVATSSPAVVTTPVVVTQTTSVPAPIIATSSYQVASYPSLVATTTTPITIPVSTTAQASSAPVIHQSVVVATPSVSNIPVTPTPQVFMSLDGKAPATTTSVTTPKPILFIKKVVGTVTLTDGTTISDAEIGAYKKETGEWVTSSSTGTGTYSFIVSPGTWEIVARPKNTNLSPTWAPTLPPFSTVFANDAKDETRTVNLTVTPLSSLLTVTILNEAGLPVPGIGVTLDTVSSLPGQTSAGLTRKILTDTTTSYGSSTFRTLAGTYFIRTLLGNSSPYNESLEEKVTLSAHQEKNITIILKKNTVTTVETIQGLTKFDTGETTNAFISGWSQEGGSVQTTSSSNGTFTLNLTGGQTWHIKATKDISGKSYSSDEQTILATGTLPILELLFIKKDAVTLPLPVTLQSNNNATSTAVKTTDGAMFNLPSQGVSSTGAVTVAITPTNQAPSLAASTLVSTAYDITVKNSDGQKISKLTKDAEIIIPYDPKELLAKGVQVENVIPSYFDESLKTWISVPNFTLNKEKNIFILRVNHLTRFALIAAADTVAPSSPTDIVTDAITPSDVRITWKNPKDDFNHSKIYRSEKIGSFGKIIAAEVFSNSFVDKTGSLTKKVYYYTIRAVDAAGNESSNNTQIAVSTLGSTLTTKKPSTSLLLPPGQALSGQITRRLALGSKGEDVKALQKALKFDGFYATSPITGFYGSKTRNAVMRFQNYYKDELLIPNGYKTGTGIVGAITAKKINEIIAKSAQ